MKTTQEQRISSRKELRLKSNIAMVWRDYDRKIDYGEFSGGYETPDFSPAGERFFSRIARS